ncbi:L,D-transpeptidase family protein [Mucilaginibacter jinjuensis]|uniref:L,D-transpeptidase family protein n=1 Tax=Mucilaginibacter jinjuensis TaxID=1176721 RepID=A0ABY7TAU0_9SPHI|nr:L,D-transpeptidase family protein [Mucilaginibacter jinjuensis]WCT13619.1 L,D-transpeptidase family protein [Mucilaginibacter jinjuensis]
MYHKALINNADMRFGQFKYFLLVITLISCFSLTSCSQNQPPKKVAKKDSLSKEWDKTIPGNFSEQVNSVFDSAQIDNFIKLYPDLKSYTGDVTEFYKKRKYAYAWFDKGKLIEQASNLANRVGNLKRNGVYKELPYQPKLDSLLNSIGTKKNQTDIKLELMLTYQYFAFSQLVWQGMDESASKSAKWYLPRKKVAYDQYLDSLLSAPAGQAKIDEPVYRQYELLRSYLRKYRALQTKETWAPIVPAKIYKVGDSSTVISGIKRRLFLLEYFKGDTTNQTFNTELQDAVKSFQSTRGLTVTGLLNKPTIAELNVPLSNRITTILVNMERSRWLPVSMDSYYLAVNIPEFKLHVYNADSLLWSCNVVVGQTVHQTTVFYGEVKYVVFSPYWNVPPGILKNEIIPGMKRNKNYLAQHNMELTGYEGGLPVVRQKPGPANSLGLVKFLFPNSYNIYLHDTPSKSLFGETTRAFSHGCIRVGEPTKLANFLLQDYKQWTPDKINKAMHQGREQYVTLTKKVPVYIAYLTSFVDRDGKINFRKDIYNLDDRLASMIVSGKGKY